MIGLPRLAVRVALASTAALALMPAAHGETLRDALVQTYRTNPDLTGQRASLRGTDEGLAIAKSGARPILNGTAGLQQDTDDLGSFRSSGRSLTVGATASLPIYSGGQVRNGIRAADARVDAGRADLRQTEGNIFTQAVSAYMDVLRDIAVVDLNAANVRVLDTNLEATRDRFQVGDLTRTDVAQSEARLAGARATLAASQGRLTTSRETYRRVIGSWPGPLDQPPPLPPLPANPDEAEEVALGNAPALASIQANVEAARREVNVARGTRLPVLSVTSSANYVDYLNSRNLGTGVPAGTRVDDTFSSGSVGLSMRLPLYQGGLAGARVRQAQAFQQQAVEQSVGVERAVISSVRAAFASYRAAGETIRSSEAAVSANRLALEGVRAEQTVGSRQILDVLNAEQELLNSQVTLVTAQRDQYVAGFALLNAMGRAEMAALNLEGGALYDPTVNYRRARRAISDWGETPVRGPEATRTTGPTPVEPAPNAKMDYSGSEGPMPAKSSIVTGPKN
ncbi:TolC family outer membrane protein [Sphingomonas naphthae]|uniref:TolC family outer membrane protein n=1 Tax=Sphingomonas naphthae TaxID=1813468 RepID=A0ABY7TJX4_9SPHN|nr:TolC family outer membrane protein [Sphingomonas naphthae]WCT73017.1 TolC family outer membrane protein [Sphingomonas naphthae]